jgi:hypothetical protein
MLPKRILRPDRLRQVPAHFSWIDHRLVRENFLRPCDHAAQALYQFLVIVADAQGLSYYSETSLSRWLKMDAAQLVQARQQLVHADLLAYEKPFYQVLALPEPHREPRAGTRIGQPLSVGAILQRLSQGGAA